MATNRSEFSVHVADPSGKVVCIGPGEEIPAWAEKLISNPLVLNGDDDGEPDEDDASADESDGDEETSGPPPKAGPGSGTALWAAYAAEHHVDVDGLNKAGIIAALSEAGVPVE